jgi:molybdopterin/thiamine biosynthesis adenylyltransferase
MKTSEWQGGWRVKREYELLELSDGSLLFNGISGRHVRLNQPAPAGLALLVRELERGANWNAALERVQAVDSAASPELLAAVFKALRQAGVMEPHQERAASVSLDPQLAPRFATFVDYLEQFATPSCNEVELFLRLRGAHVTILGVGGAGSLCAMLLAGCGIGTLRLVDGDSVEETNLVRQFFYESAGVGKPKVTELARRVQAFTPFTRVETVERYVRSAADVHEVTANTDFLLLCADAPRFLLNRWVNQACVSAQLPYVNAFNGIVGPIYVPDQSPCFECFEASIRDQVGELHDQMVDALQQRRPRPYPSSADGCVLIATLQTRECLAYISRAWQPRTLGRLQRIDARGLANSEELPRRADCCVCGPGRGSRSTSGLSAGGGVAA